MWERDQDHSANIGLLAGCQQVREPAQIGFGQELLRPRCKQNTGKVDDHIYTVYRGANCLLPGEIGLNRGNIGSVEQARRNGLLVEHQAKIAPRGYQMPGQATSKIACRTGDQNGDLTPHSPGPP